MKKIHVFTSAAFNYIPKVRVLFESLRRLHPDWVLHLALSDRMPADADLSHEPFDHVWPLESLDIPDWLSWSFCHDIVELSTAIKPFLLDRLLAREDAAMVFYMDPDTVAFSRLDDLVDALGQGNILLTPHQTDPESTLSAIRDNEISSLKHGVFNLGFLGVNKTTEGARFARWWSDRIYHFCVSNIPNGLFTDQKWIDLVPAFFDGVVVMRSGRHNVATWNLTTRFLHSEGSVYKVDDELLGFYHFTGFDSGAHRAMALKNAADNVALKELLSWYGKINDAARDDPLASQPWAFGFFDNQQKILREQRLVYRLRSDLRRAFPDPYQSTGYLQWWQSQGALEYPEFFQSDRREAALKQLSSVLPEGFEAQSPAQLARRIFSVAATALSSVDGFNFVRSKAFEVIRREGLAGALSKLKK